MKNNIIIMFLALILSSCGIFQEEIIEPKVELTPEQIEHIEKEKFENLLEKEDKKNLEIIQEKKQGETDRINTLYELERKKMTGEDLEKEKQLLNLDKMKITPLIK